MKHYPLRVEDVISKEDIAAGRTKFIFSPQEYVEYMNGAFYTGFITANLDTKEEADELTPTIRALLCAAAGDKSALLCGAEDPKMLETVIAKLEKSMEGASASAGS